MIVEHAERPRAIANWMESMDIVAHAGANADDAAQAAAEPVDYVEGCFLED